MGVYQAGRNTDLDKALNALPALKRLFSQPPEDRIELDEILLQLQQVLDKAEAINRPAQVRGAAR